MKGVPLAKICCRCGLCRPAHAGKATDASCCVRAPAGSGPSLRQNRTCGLFRPKERPGFCFRHAVCAGARARAPRSQRPRWTKRSSVISLCQAQNCVPDASEWTRAALMRRFEARQILALLTMDTTEMKQLNLRPLICRPSTSCSQVFSFKG